MSVNANIKSAGLLHAGGFTAIVAALAMVIAPSGAMAQERGKWQGGGQQSAQSQRGSNSGAALRGNRSGGEGGRAAVRTDRRSSESVRGPSFRGDAGSQSSRATRARPQDNAVARARIEAAQRQRVDTVRQAQAQRDVRRDGQQWSGRNRTYSDQDRNRTYRQGVRDGVRNDNARDRIDQRQAYRQGWRDNNRNDRWRGNDRNRYQNNWNRDWRRDNRYDWHSYRNLNRNQYRLGRYYAPYRGYSYRRVGIGFSLAPLFFGSNYWINDPWSFRLPPAYAGTRWIRYYDDALLVESYSGEVIDVIENFFW